MLEDLVRDVPRDITHRTGTRVAPYHRGARDFERGERSGIRCVREVDKDSETVEFPDESLAVRAAAARLARPGLDGEERRVCMSHLSPLWSGLGASNIPQESANTLWQKCVSVR